MLKWSLLVRLYKFLDKRFRWFCLVLIPKAEKEREKKIKADCMVIIKKKKTAVQLRGMFSSV